VFASAYLASVSSAAFNDSLSRFALLPLSAAAYSDAPKHCLVNQMKTTKVSLPDERSCENRRVGCVTTSDRTPARRSRSSTRPDESSAFPSEARVKAHNSSLRSLTLFEEKVDFENGGKTSKYFN
ncbi:hypothetical protein PENTCL1PPCAC_24645, partial [Pristionchus entomophagus]